MFFKNHDSFHSECKEESTVNNMLRTKKIKNIKSFEDCRNKCQQNVKCDFFNFKVQSFEFGILFQLIHFQHHQNLKKRRCVLLEVFTEKTGWVSGDKLCSSSKSTTASTALMNTTTINLDGGTLNLYINLNQINNTLHIIYFSGLILPCPAKDTSCVAEDRSNVIRTVLVESDDDCGCKINWL